MLSRQTLEILLDLVEIKLSTIIVQDKDDIREVRRLKNCRNELVAYCGQELKNGKILHKIETLSSQAI